MGTTGVSPVAGGRASTRAAPYGTSITTLKNRMVGRGLRTRRHGAIERIKELKNWMSSLRSLFAEPLDGMDRTNGPPVIAAAAVRAVVAPIVPIGDTEVPRVGVAEGRERGRDG